jgi:NADPH:quinone reductase-like Zn-dependent oxidoreductase
MMNATIETVRGEAKVQRRMAAVVFDRFGGPEVYRMGDEPIPAPGKGEVRVAVRAASINPIDWKIRKGEMKLMSGSRFPMHVGGDFAGVIEAVGPGVTAWKIGDEVMGLGAGMKGGAFAEAMIARVQDLVRKPAKVSFEEGACLLVALAALQALRDVAQARAGMRVLINGCTGGVGLPAIQLAKAMGLHVTGTCSTQSVALARELGADEVIDYRKEDVVARGGRYDVILDLATSLGFAKARALLAPRGVYVDPAPTPARIVGSAIANLFRSQKLKVLLSAPKPADLERLQADLASGKLRTIVDRSFRLAEVVDAFRYAEKGGMVGKVVLRP